jgi:hypothetical protein
MGEEGGCAGRRDANPLAGVVGQPWAPAGALFVMLGNGLTGLVCADDLNPPYLPPCTLLQAPSPSLTFCPPSLPPTSHYLLNFRCC